MMPSTLKISLVAGIALMTAGCPTISGPGAGPGGSAPGIANTVLGAGAPTGGTAGPASGAPDIGGGAAGMTQESPEGGSGGSDAKEESEGSSDSAGTGGGAASTGTMGATPSTIAGMPSGPIPHDLPVGDCETLILSEAVAVENSGDLRVAVKGYLKCRYSEHREDGSVVVTEKPVVHTRVIITSLNIGSVMTGLTSDTGCFYAPTASSYGGDSLKIEAVDHQLAATVSINVSTSSLQLAPCSSSSIQILPPEINLPMIGHMVGGTVSPPGEAPIPTPAPQIKIDPPPVTLPPTSSMAGKVIAPLLKQ